MGDHRDLFYYAGGSIVETVVLRNASGNVVDITGAAISMKLFQTREGTELFEKTVGSGITITDPTGGTFQTSTDNADTVNLQPGQYWLEIIITIGAITYSALTSRLTIARTASTPVKNPQSESGGGSI